MIQGFVTEDGTPLILIQVNGHKLVALIDTGFNDDIDLPAYMREQLTVSFVGEIETELAGGLVVEESLYELIMEFDGERRCVLASFSDTTEALIGTGLLQKHRLEVDFVLKTVWIVRAIEAVSSETDPP